MSSGVSWRLGGACVPAAAPPPVSGSGQATVTALTEAGQAAFARARPATTIEPEPRPFNASPEDRVFVRGIGQAQRLDRHRHQGVDVGG